MRALIAFIKKEFTEQLRSGRLAILVPIFILLGIMGPAIAKLTPWLLDAVADSLAGSGMVIADVKASPMDSWVQFFKNLPVGLIAFVLLESSIFTREYASGTLVLALTKGLERYKAVVSKAAVLAVLWTACFWICFGTTYGCSAYLWGKPAVQNLGLSVACWWLFGLWVTMLTVLFSTLAKSNIGVLAGTGGVVFASYLLGLVPKLKEYLPVMLADGNSLVFSAVEAQKYVAPAAVTVALIAVCLALSFPIFNKKQL